MRPIVAHRVGEERSYSKPLKGLVFFFLLFRSHSRVLSRRMGGSNLRFKGNMLDVLMGINWGRGEGVEVGKLV